jgi:hypothetical protein
MPLYMRPRHSMVLVASLGGLFTVVNLATAAVRYVDLNSASPTPPNTSRAPRRPMERCREHPSGEGENRTKSKNTL